MSYLESMIVIFETMNKLIIIFNLMLLLVQVDLLIKFVKSECDF
jgi:hypothetical protein